MACSIQLLGHLRWKMHCHIRRFPRLFRLDLVTFSFLLASRHSSYMSDPSPNAANSGFIRPSPFAYHSTNGCFFIVLEPYSTTCGQTVARATRQRGGPCKQPLSLGSSSTADPAPRASKALKTVRNYLKELGHYQLTYPPVASSKPYPSSIRAIHEVTKANQNLPRAHSPSSGRLRRWSSTQLMSNTDVCTLSSEVSQACL